MNKESILKALEEINKDKRNFDQSIDLIINLKKIDIRKNPINTFIILPHQTGERKICAFLTKDFKEIDVIKKEDFKKYEGKNAKKLAKKYDFFIAAASLMPTIAASFGRVLGASGKMPSPQLGIVALEDEKAITAVITKMKSAVRIKAKEPSIKVKIGKQSMKAEEIFENIDSIYTTILKLLPAGKDNLRNVMLKLTMSKPQKIE
jgi:large subunit ribosomal protein L1